MEVDSAGIFCKLAQEFGLKRDTTEERLKLQKTVYLLQTSGLRLGYGFSWYRYGPYSQELVYDAYRALQSERARYARETRPWGFSEKTTTWLESFRRKLGGFLGDAKKLELLASLDFVVKTWHPDATKGNIAQLFKKRKQRFYDGASISDREIERAFDLRNKLLTT